MEIEMTLLSCWKCHVPFCISEKYYQARVKDHQGFSCPNGHLNYFNGKSDEEKLREQLKRTQDDLVHKKNLHERALAEVASYRDAELKRVEKYLKSRFVGDVKTLALSVFMGDFDMKHQYALSILRRVKGFETFRDEDRKYHIKRNTK